MEKELLVLVLLKLERLQADVLELRAQLDGIEGRNPECADGSARRMGERIDKFAEQMVALGLREELGWAMRMDS
jgi:hypothetical protein